MDISLLLLGIGVTMMRVLIILLLLSFQCCYLRWGGGNTAFIFQMEYELLFSGKLRAGSLAHPAILLPLSGQILLLVELFYKTPRRWLVLVGLALTSLLVLLILLAGLLARDVKMIISCLPFIMLSILFVLQFGRKRAMSLIEERKKL